MFSKYKNKRRYDSLRYSGRDYSLPGKYFVTICTYCKKKWFGDIINSKMHLSEIGQIASDLRWEIPVHFSFIGLDAFVVMPDHIHGIIIINRSIGQSLGALHATPLPPPDATHRVNKIMTTISPKPGSLSVIIRSYKSAVTKHAHKIDSDFSWQRGFYDNIICTTGQMSRIRKYVLDNVRNHIKKF